MLVASGAQKRKLMKKAIRSILFTAGLVIANAVHADLPDADTLSAIEATTPLSADSLPMNGTFYSAANPNGPPLPGDINGLPAWDLGDGTYLLDDLDGFSGFGMRAMDDMSPPGFEDAGTNDYEPAFTPPQVFTTNQLWLQMITVTNSTASMVIHPPWNVTNGVYDLYYSTNVILPFASWQWLLRTDAGQTNLIVPNATDADGFYRLGPPDDLTANDSEGTNFWLAFCGLPYGGNLSLSISSPVGATGTVTIPGLGITNTFSVAAGGMTNIIIPLAALLGDSAQDYVDYNVVATNGIHVTASQPVSVYGLDYDQYATAAFTGYPTTLLGTNYCILSHAAEDDFGGGLSEFAIVATASNTTVKIMPSATADLAEYLATNTIWVTNLQPGETFQLRGEYSSGDDVTGTWITSDKPIAVFAGADLANVPDEDTESPNPLVQEQLPVDSWGRQALALSFAGRTNGDSYRVLAAYSNTMVTITGKVVTVVDEPSGGPWTVTTTNETVTTNLAAGEFCDIIVDGPVEFQGSKPIQVAQFANGCWSDSFFNNLNSPYPEGDPCEILLPPTGHYLETNTVVTLPNDDITGDFDENFLNLIVAQSAITNTLVDGATVAVTNFVAIGTSGYYGAQITVTNSGTHTVTSSQPIAVEIYGFGSADAYGYFGGIVK